MNCPRCGQPIDNEEHTLARAQALGREVTFDFTADDRQTVAALKRVQEELRGDG